MRTDDRVPKDGQFWVDGWVQYNGMPHPKTDEPGRIRLKTHFRDQCIVDATCCIHAPSMDALPNIEDWPYVWRGDKQMMERTCPHGIGHPDPDDLAFQKTKNGGKEPWLATHGCDGCCHKSA